MGILLFDPVGDVEVHARAEGKVLDTLKGKVVGYVFNQHISSLEFWKNLEENVESVVEPSGTLRFYKPNTWAPAPQAEIQRVIHATDFALVGVGA